MTDDPTDRLAGQGIDVPALDRLSPADSGVFGFPSAGDEAVAWWRRLRAASGATGYWPVLTEPEGSIVAEPFVVDADRLARAAELDADEVLNPRGTTLHSLDDEQREQLLDGWPDEPYRVQRLGLPFSRTGGPAPTLVALVPAAHGWQVPTLLGFGDWNECPRPEVHGAVLRHWHERYGADLVCLARAGLELAVTRPPRTRPDALAFAWEYASYCADGVDVLYQADNLAGLAAGLIEAEVVPAWWD